MKIILQDRLSLRYLKHIGIWTTNHREAAVFSDSAEALNFCLRNNLSNLYILLKFGEDKYDVRLLVGENPRPKVALAEHQKCTQPEPALGVLTPVPS